ncbi:MAG: glycerophosphodiester phosphodiesterase family protein [Stappiaceae bacterium]
MAVRSVLLVVLTALSTLYIVNASWVPGLLGQENVQDPVLLSIGGIHHPFEQGARDADECVANAVQDGAPPFIENTIPALEAAYSAGADLIAIDIQPTIDGDFAVFRDSVVNCRTNGAGETRTYTMSQLKRLDIGYGYTADRGLSYPFRYRGVGLMPSLDDIIQRFPIRRIILNLRSEKENDGNILAAYLKGYAPEILKNIIVLGDDKPINALQARIPSLTVTTPKRIRDCLDQYVLLGWLTIVPEVCKETVLLLPADYIDWLPGWPHRFHNRFENAGTTYFLIEEFTREQQIQGIDTQQALLAMPPQYQGGIATNRIELVAPAISDLSTN